MGEETRLEGKTRQKAVGSVPLKGKQLASRWAEALPPVPRTKTEVLGKEGEMLRARLDKEECQLICKENLRC